MATRKESGNSASPLIVDRRQFLRVLGAGSAIVSLPWLGQGCASHASRVRMTRRSSGPSGHTTYFDGFGLSIEKIQKVLARGLARGGDFSEVFLQHKVTHWLGMEDGQVNRAYSVVDLGAGIRVLKGEATGFAYCEDLTESSLLAAAETAASVADGPPGRRAKPLKAVSIKNRYHVALPWSEVGVDRKLPIVERVDKETRAKDPRIIKVTVFLNDETSRMLVANSEGRLVEDDHPMAVLNVSCVARHKGRTETGYQSISSADGPGFFTEKIIRKVAHEAADYTTMLFGAVSPPVGTWPVVLAPGVTGILLHEAIGHGMEADFNRKGISIYADRIGKRVAPEFVTIVDDGTNERMRGSINVDDEGTRAARTVLVENGILRSYMHDRISARHYRVKQTGSGRRDSFRFPPLPRMRNTYMLNGPHKPEEIIRSVKKGIYAEVFSNGQVFIGAGDFTFYLKHGRLIENGKLTRVIKDANLIGSGPKVLERVDMVGDDLAMYSGAGYCGKDGQRVPVGFGLPTVRAQSISIGGRQS